MMMSDVASHFSHYKSATTGGVLMIWPRNWKPMQLEEQKLMKFKKKMRQSEKVIVLDLVLLKTHAMPRMLCVVNVLRRTWIVRQCTTTAIRFDSKRRVNCIVMWKHGATRSKVQGCTKEMCKMCQFDIRYVHSFECAIFTHSLDILFNTMLTVGI